MNFTRGLIVALTLTGFAGTSIAAETPVEKAEREGKKIKDTTGKPKKVKPEDKEEAGKPKPKRD